jgi:LPS sulfotransferase NodH
MASNLDDLTTNGPITPNFFIIGAARSGTTMLTEMLRQHPSIFLTQPKEPHFLALANQKVDFNGPGDDSTINRLAVTSLESYLSLYGSASGRSARGDASVSTLYYSQRSLENLEREFPGARLIVVLRDPIARAFSAFSYMRVRGFEPVAEFLEAVRQEDQRKRENWHHLWHYVSMGHYGEQLKPFIETLGPERVKVVFYENLTRDSAEVVQQIFRFLDVDDGIEVQTRQVNASGSARSPLAQKSIQWATRHRALRSSLKRVLPFEMRERIRQSNLEPTDVPIEARKALTASFESDVADLRGLLSHHYPDTNERAPEWLTPTPEAGGTQSE